MNASPSSTPPDERLATLRQALGQARDALQQQPLPPSLGASIQARVVASAAASAPAPAMGRPLLRRWAWSGALACTLLLVGSVVLMLGGPAVSPHTEGSDTLAGFLPLVPQEDWPQGTAPAWLVNTELRADRLAALGLPFDPARAGDSVQAQLLVRPSGEVLAVRFLQ